MAPELRYGLVMNVYYLTSRSSAAAASSDPDWPSFSIRLRNAWWRLRLALMEIRASLRSRPRYSEDLREFDVPTTPAPARPARIIDFEAARRRLRPATGG
jgi:hypothetical protein